MSEQRIYQKSKVAGFMRIKEENGVFSNMHGGFPMVLCNQNVRSVEHYYQAMRFSHLPRIQEKILAEKSPMAAKKIAWQSISESRPDWRQVNIALMRHGLRLKYAHHPAELKQHLAATETRPIVEISWKDNFWGAKPVADRFEGQNILGRLWMELREEVALHKPDTPFLVKAPKIPDALFCGERIMDFSPDVVMSEQSDLNF